MRALRSVLALAAMAGCSSTELQTIASSVEAGQPPTPVYQRTIQDFITGDNTPVVVMGGTASCPANQRCYIAEAGGDSYAEDLYERPAGQGSLARQYAPALDITSGEVGVTANWLYYRINLFGPQTGQQLGTPGAFPNHYGIEINLDDDVMGDLIIDLTAPSQNLGINWGTVGVLAKSDANETMGGPNPLLPDGPGQAGGGYERNEFNQGLNLVTGAPGGMTAVQGRVNGSAIELAIYRPWLEALTTDTVDSLGIRPYSDTGQVSTSELYTHDDQNRNGIGSPYPWLALTGAPASCPTGSSGDANLTAAQIAALESGTNVNTGITNPCYATGGIYMRDNMGTIHDLARQDTIQIDVDLSLTKTDAVDPVGPGDPIVYTLTVTNNTMGIVTGARITDPLPGNVVFVSASSPGCTYNAVSHTVTCQLSAMAPLSSTSVNITVTAASIGNVTNTAAVTSNGDELTPANNTDSETTTVMLLCGNGQVNPGEVCDDGNNINGDTCNNDCRRSNGQPCTMDNQCSSGVCDPFSMTCEPAFTCGNGELEPANGEICDDGNTAGNDGCEADCKRSNGQPCTNDNQCSSGECDETGSMVCVPPTGCGNGVVNAGEICDDGDAVNGNGCDNDCKLSDGQPCTGDNQCHSDVCDPASDVCEPANTCGNGRLEALEACDDGGTSNGDGCSASCLLEDGEPCVDDDQCQSGECDEVGSQTCEPANSCGNGTINPGEACDDGNTGGGDGCSASCLIEDGEPCTDDDQCQSGMCDPQTDTCGGGDQDGDGVFDGTDLDDDNDGIPDALEDFDTDGDTVPDRLDLDSDNDGIPDATEAGHTYIDGDGDFVMDCPWGAYGVNGYCDSLETEPDSGSPTMNAQLDADIDGIADVRDLDSDNDSIPDLVEGGSGCPDPNHDAICDGNDPDKDGIVNSLEAQLSQSSFGTLAREVPRDTDNDGGWDYRDLDADGDSVFDIQETTNTGLDLNNDGKVDATNDTDSDGIRDVADDSDLDKIPDSVDDTPPSFGGYIDGVVNTDGSGDGPDFLDPDSDNDGSGDVVDNCRVVQNGDQADHDGDFIGDACDDTDDREWGIQGGCGGCATNDAPTSSLVLMLGALYGLLGRRRRRRVVEVAGAAVAVGLVTLPSTADAQAPSVEANFGTERFQLATDSDGILDVESGAVRPHLEIDMALWLGYANDPLVLNRKGTGGREEVGSLVADQIGGELLASVGLFGRAQLALILPVVLVQDDNLDANLMAPTAGSGNFAIGDLRLVPKLSLVKQSDFGLDIALLATVTLPTSSGDGFAGDEGVTFAPALALSRRLDGGWRMGLLGGYRARGESMELDLRVDDEVFAGAGIGLDLAATDSAPVIVDASFSLATAADDMFGEFNRNYAEVKGGLTIDVPGPLVGFVATGAGVAEGWGTPDWRALAGVRTAPERASEKLPPKEIADSDRDGLYDNVDRCPMEPEDMDQFEDTDGCPDTDDDKDGVLDATDRCRLEPEDVDQFEDTDGCPENDNDNDTILDAQDKCPVQPEDVDSFQDEDGCPELDNDNDTVQDGSDQCPLVAGPVENNGCPWPDRDGDGVIDKFDNCPTWKGKPENNGCALPQLVKITESKLELYETTYFATGKATIQKRSFKLLDQVATVLRGHPELQIRIEGHTDSVGSNAKNLKLSQARAESVMKYLVKKGVDAARLSAQGFGEEQPIADNKSAKGRSQNRRVEFMATRTVETVQQQPAAPPAAAPSPAPAPAPLEKP